MQDDWYADHRDVVKWSVLHHLADTNRLDRVLQIAYYRPGQIAQITMDGQQLPVPDAVRTHFRNIRNAACVPSSFRVTVFDVTFNDRAVYHQAVAHLLRAFDQERCAVFLDPDTGLEPQNNAGFQHVLDADVQRVWHSMKENDFLIFYQHQTNRAGQPWIEPKRTQLAQSIGIQNDQLLVAQGQDPRAQDVVFYYAQKT
jgi:hypothetical protein